MNTLTLKPLHPAAALRWIARIGSLATLGMLLFMPSGVSFRLSELSATEWFGLLCFPTGVAFGLVVAWKWEAPGGWITLASLAALCLVQFFLGTFVVPIWAIGTLAVPGILFVLLPYFNRGESR